MSHETANRRSSRRRLRLRRAQRAAIRAARRARIASRVRARRASHATIGVDGTVSTVEVDLVRCEAALATFELHPHDPDDDDADDAGVDVPMLDDDCPLCRAIAWSRIGDPVPFGLGRGAC